MATSSNRTTAAIATQVVREKIRRWGGLGSRTGPAAGVASVGISDPGASVGEATVDVLKESASRICVTRNESLKVQPPKAGWIKMLVPRAYLRFVRHQLRRVCAGLYFANHCGLQVHAPEFRCF